MRLHLIRLAARSTFPSRGRLGEVQQTDLNFRKISNQRIKAASLSTPSSERRDAPLAAQGGECANIEYIFVTGFAFFVSYSPSVSLRSPPPSKREATEYRTLLRGNKDKT